MILTDPRPGPVDSLMTEPTSSNTGPQSIRIHGKVRPFLRRQNVRRRIYYLLEKVGSPLRERYQAFDPYAGPGGNFFLVQFWREDENTRQFLNVIRRLKDDTYPRVIEWERFDNEYAFVLTWVHGISLADYLLHLKAGRRPAPDPSEVVRLIRALAHSVCRLHTSFRIVHGDLQPANLVITNHPSRLMLIDFGSAWTMESTMRRVDGDGRHPVYTAPDFRESGFHGDQFSISVLFYELLTLQIPYSGLGGKAGKPELIDQARRVQEAPSAVSHNCQRLTRSLRERLDACVLRGLSLRAADRFPDRHAWLNSLNDLHLEFQRPPQVPQSFEWMTKVTRWWSNLVVE